MNEVCVQDELGKLDVRDLVFVQNVNMAAGQARRLTDSPVPVGWTSNLLLFVRTDT